MEAAAAGSPDRHASDPVAAQTGEFPGSPGDVTVSIIVTNFNYGHFLDACLASVAGQTAGCQIIVVDDGSTDGSNNVLKRFAGRVTPIVKQNGGQASAFNAGFAAATGDVIVFLDSDDELHDDCVEIIKARWRQGTVSLAFGLEMIDAGGRSCGVYRETLMCDSGDNRPLLLRRGYFGFSPTSGNAFARSFLEMALPMPEPRWRISADAYLVRAAALAGPCIALNQICGRYRIHAGNNYYRDNAPPQWNWRRVAIDMADALRDLQHWNRLSEDPTGAALLRTALRFSELSVFDRFDHVGGFDIEAMRRARRSARAIFREPLPLSRRLPAFAVLMALGCGGWRFAGLRRQALGRPAQHAGAVAQRVDRLSGLSSLKRQLSALERPRWPPELPLDRQLRFTEPGVAQNMLAEGWDHHQADGAQWSAGPEAVLAFCLPPMRASARLAISIAMREEACAEGAAIEGVIGGIVVDRCQASPACGIGFDIAPDIAPKPGAPLILVIRVATARNARRPGASWNVNPFGVRSLICATIQNLPATTYLPIGEERPFGPMLAGNPARHGWLVEDQGTAGLAQMDAHCTFSTVNDRLPLEILLRLAPPVPAGILRLGVNDQVPLVFDTSDHGDGLRIILPGPGETPAPVLDVGLSVSFDPTDRGEGAPLQFASIGLHRATAAAPDDEPLPVRLNPGQIVHFINGGRELSPTGWLFEPGFGLANTHTEASLSFRLATGLRDPVLHLEIEPDAMAVPAQSLVVGASIDGQLIARARLLGASTLQVPIPAGRWTAADALFLGLHGAVVDTDMSSAVRPESGRFFLKSLRLEATQPALFSAFAPGLAATAGASSLEAMLDDASVLLSRQSDDAEAGQSLAILRSRLAAELGAISENGLAVALRRKTLLPNLCAIRLATAGFAMSGTEGPAIDPAAAGTTPQSRLRAILRILLLGPIYRHIRETDILDPPFGLLAHAGEYGKALISNTDRGLSLDDSASLAKFETMALNAARRLIRQHDPSSLSHHFGCAIVKNMRLDDRHDAGRDSRALQRVWTAATELVLHHDGCRIASRPNMAGPSRMPLIGLVTRQFHSRGEGDLSRAIASGWNPAVGRLVIVTLAAALPGSGGDSSAHVILNFPSQDASECVAAIKTLGCAAVVLADAANCLDSFTQVGAHKLAPVQIAIPQYAPGTECFGSVTHIARAHRSNAASARWTLHPKIAGREDAAGDIVAIREDIAKMDSPTENWHGFQDAVIGSLVQKLPPGVPGPIVSPDVV